MSNSNKLGRVIALDVGKKRIGSAITDELRIISKPHKIFDLKGSINSTLKEIIKDCENLEAKTIIIGFPLELDGSIGKQATFTKKVVLSLIKLISEDTEIAQVELALNQNISAPPYTIQLIDERFTSVQAEHSLSNLNLKNKERREEKDNVSAMIILETYLGKANNSL